MVIKITDYYCMGVVDAFMENNPNIAEKYQIKKTNEYDDCLEYEFSCDKVEDLFSFMSKLRKNSNFIPIMYDNFIDLFFGTLGDY